jgi:hypothetical protein
MYPRFYTNLHIHEWLQRYLSVFPSIVSTLNMSKKHLVVYFTCYLLNDRNLNTLFNSLSPNQKNSEYCPYPVT